MCAPSKLPRWKLSARLALSRRSMAASQLHRNIRHILAGEVTDAKAQEVRLASAAKEARDKAEELSLQLQPPSHYLRLLKSHNPHLGSRSKPKSEKLQHIGFDSRVAAAVGLSELAATEQ
eukprot:g22515.t1